MNADVLFLLATHALKILPPAVWLALVLVSALWLLVVTRVWSQQPDSVPKT